MSEKIKGLEYLDKIFVQKHYIAMVRLGGIHRNLKFKYRDEVSCPVIKGVFLGYRTIKEGNVVFVDDEVGYIFEQTKSIRCALVSFDSRKNPVKIPLSGITMYDPDCSHTEGSYAMGVSECYICGKKVKGVSFEDGETVE